MNSNSFNKENETVKFNIESNGAMKASKRATTYGTTPNVQVKETSVKNKNKQQMKDDKSTGVVSFASLFRFSNALDFFYMFIGTIASLAHGATFPLMLLIFGNLTDIFTKRTVDFCAYNLTLLDEYCPPGVHLTVDNFLSEYKKCNFSGLNITFPDIDFGAKIREQTLWLIIMGGGTIVLGYFQVAFWSIACERQIRRLRERLLRAILSKEIAYFDMNKTGQLNTRLNEDVNKVHDGTGDKLGSAFQFTAGFFAGLALGFVKGWLLTLVILSVSPILFISAVLITKMTAAMTSQELKSYAKAGAIAEEVFSSIRTVFSYNGAAYESKRYEIELNAAKRSGIRKGAINGLLMGIIFCLMFATYALGFWYGAKLIREQSDVYSIGSVLTIFFAIITAVFSLGQAAPHFQALAQARGAAYTLWEIIDTPSVISINNQNGIQKDELMGAVRFSDVQFVYPSRTDVPVLNGLSFTAQPGETTALVGTSGCGKSTCMQLLQRFYDPLYGSVEIDGITVDQYNLTWLRGHIGVVSQEPVLFQTTIRENILFGRADATQKEVEDAARMANAHDFITQLPDGYDTLVGERGAQLSGGQKQRIAIARALVRDPRILLLDEATSALDAESERVVQEALDRASEGRTTIVIAHRLSTIRNASKIVVLNKGIVVEEGNHDTLMNAGGAYYALIEAQNLRSKDEDNDDHDNQKSQLPMNQRKFSNIDHYQYENEHTVRKMSRQKNDKANENMEYAGPSPFFSMLKMNVPETCYIILGCIMCICNGGVQPAFGVILSKVIVVFQICDKETQEERVLMYILLFIGLGLVMLFSMFLQSFLFAISGERLTQRLRAKIFRTLLKQEVAYFDNPDNNTGALCTRLATEASDVQGATGIQIGTMLQNISNLGVGIVLAFYYGWSLTLVVLGFIPFVIIAGFLQTYLMTGFGNKDKSALENAGKIAVESISNIRTVAQLTKEQYFGDEYSKLLETPYRNSLKRAHIFAVLFGFTDAIMFFAQAALFTFGAWQVDNNRMTFENIMLVMNCIIFGAMAVGQTASMSPDYSKAIVSSKKILTLFNRKPAIDNSSADGKILDHFDGQIDLTSLKFHYPNRPEVSVLTNFHLTIEPNKQIALVGSSGCGKSTIIQLLERFYDPTSGQILIDQNDLSTLNLQWWRNQIGFVSQEPVLFDASIRKNIAYGDTSREVSFEEIQRAAQAANIDKFIENLPEQYETNVGSKGTQLSGGEKQRVAIARALIRNPKILLLDEATSALDNESERVVQEALDQASQGRTTIVIAHRLSTIQNSDVIYVLHRGQIVEFGKHDQLLERKGYYYRLTQSKK